MSDFDWPDDLAPTDSSFYLQHSSSVFESPFTGQRQVLARAPARWVCRMNFVGTPTRGAAAGKMDAMLAKLRGQLNRVRIFDWRRRDGVGVPRSHDDYAATVERTFFDDVTAFTDGTGFVVAGLGTPTNAAAPAGATSIALSGLWPGAVARAAGDYVGFGDHRCYMVVEPAVPDVNGDVVLTIEPPLRAAVSAGTIQLSDVRAVFRLTSDTQGSNPTDVNFASRYELEFTEDLIA